MNISSLCITPFKVLLRTTVFLFVFHSATLHAQSCGCTKTLTAASDGGIYVSGITIGAKPGDVICIKAGRYKFIQLLDFNGTATQPIVFKNCGGQVIVVGNNAYGVMLIRSSFFKFTGTGSADVYGFSIRTDSTGVNMGIGFKVTTHSTDFEVDHLEISKATNGLQIKTDPTCDPSTWDGAFTMRNVSLNHLFVHDTKAEAFYIGYTFETATITCNGLSKVVKPQKIMGLKIYNNLVQNSGWDGIQVSSTPENCFVYNNRIYNYGTENHGIQQTGIIFNGGTNGSIYNNLICRGTGPGIQVFGQGKVCIFNNIVNEPGYNNSDPYMDGIFVDDRPRVGYPSLSLFISNNTIIMPIRSGIKILNTHGTLGSDNEIFNNLIIASKTYTSFFSRSAIDVVSSVTFTASNNLNIPTIDSAKLINPKSNNFDLTTLSPALNKGKDLSAYTNYIKKNDYLYTTRPQGGLWDVGAYEHITTAALQKTSIGINIVTNLTVENSNTFPAGLTIAPVPTRDRLNIFLNDDEAKGTVLIRITDGSGKIVVLKSGLNKAEKILQEHVDVSNLLQGIYYFEAIVDQKRFVSKFVKMAN